MPTHIFNTFDDPSELTPSTQALGVNDTDQIVGLYQTASGYHGFLESGGTYTPLDDSLATATVAQGINGMGQIVGWYNSASGSHGFLYSSGERI